MGIYTLLLSRAPGEDVVTLNPSRPATKKYWFWNQRVKHHEEISLPELVGLFPEMTREEIRQEILDSLRVVELYHF